MDKLHFELAWSQSCRVENLQERFPFFLDYVSSTGAEYVVKVLTSLESNEYFEVLVTREGYLWPLCSFVRMKNDKELPVVDQVNLMSNLWLELPAPFSTIDQKSSDEISRETRLVCTLMALWMSHVIDAHRGKSGRVELQLYFAIENSERD